MGCVLLVGHRVGGAGNHFCELRLKIERKPAHDFGTMKNDRFSKTILLATAVVVALPFSLQAEAGEEANFSLKTELGKSYVGCKVLKVDPDGLTVSHSQGIAKIAFTELSQAVQKKHGYDKGKSDAFIKKHTEVVRRVVPVKVSRQSPNIPPYLPNGAVSYGAGYGYGYGYPYYFDYGYGNREGDRSGGQRSYPYYQTYPNVSFQAGSGRRAGNPIAPPLISPSNFQQQQNAVQNRAGYPAPKLPVVRPRISSPNRPTAVFPRAAPRLSAPRITRPSRALPSKR